jgi:hypothetical protein
MPAVTLGARISAPPASPPLHPARPLRARPLPWQGQAPPPPAAPLVAWRPAASRRARRRARPQGHELGRAGGARAAPSGVRRPAGAPCPRTPAPSAAGALPQAPVAPACFNPQAQHTVGAQPGNGGGLGAGLRGQAHAFIPPRGTWREHQLIKRLGMSWLPLWPGERAERWGGVDWVGFGGGAGRGAAGGEEERAARGAAAVCARSGGQLDRHLGTGSILQGQGRGSRTSVL